MKKIVMADHSGHVFLFDGEFTKDGLDAVFSTLKDEKNVEDVHCTNVHDNKNIYAFGTNDPLRLDAIKDNLVRGKLTEIECNVSGNPRSMSGENFFHIERLSDDRFQVQAEGDSEDMEKKFSVKDAWRGTEVLYYGLGDFEVLTKK